MSSVIETEARRVDRTFFLSLFPETGLLLAVSGEPIVAPSADLYVAIALAVLGVSFGSTRWLACY